MKRIFNILFAALALVAFQPILSAQPDVVIDKTTGNPNKYEVNEKGIAYAKGITGPNTDGEYTIHLHTFVKGDGTVTHSNRAADIVLVLDVSGSMEKNMTVYPYNAISSTGYSYDSIGYSYNNPKYILYNGQYYPVYRDYYGHGTWFDYTIDGYYLYFTTKGGEKLYLYGTEVQRTMPSDITSDSQTIWTGVLYQRGYGETKQKMEELKKSVKTFIDLIAENNIGSDGTTLHNQISIVKFAGNNYYDGDETSASETGNHKYSSNQSYSGNWIEFGNNNFTSSTRYNTTEIVKGFTEVDEAGVAALKAAVDQLYPGGGTAADHGMKKAFALIKTLYDPETDKPLRPSNKTVVFFTDGDPGQSGNWNTESRQCAVNAIKASNEIKSKLAYTEGSTPNNVTVFSISVFGDNNYTNNRNTYMNRISSNYPNATGMDNGEAGNNGNPSGIYYQDASAGSLEDVFRMIANESGGNQALNSSTLTTIDVVSQSFTLPQGTEGVEIYEAAVKSVSDDGSIEFDPFSKWKPAAGVILVPDSSDPNKVTAKGFDYAGKYCGTLTVDGVKQPHGSKLVLRIPIKMSDTAVGGPGVETNGPGSGIYVDGNNEFPFESPVVDLPVNLQIKKLNLNKGESAKFKIQRISDTIDPSTAAESDWVDVTSVFVTKTNDKDPDVFIRGLAPGYHYRILEENWSWSYNFVSASGAAYVIDVDDIDKDGDIKEKVMGTVTVTDRSKVTSDKFVSNPITFTDMPKANIESNVHHAESKAVNTFNGSDPVFVDSKANTRGTTTPPAEK